MSKTQSQRLAYGEELVALGRENKDVVVLEADLGKSTMSYLFQQEFPERYFEMGIAEQNMLSTAAGLAVSGKIAFCNSFAVFAAGRPYDQIRQTISVGKLNVKICGSSAGRSDFGDGSSHQAVEDVAIMSAIPNMTVLTPCDAKEVRQCVRAAAEIQGPVYIRVLRNDMPDILPEDAQFQLGAPRVLKEGSDVVVFAHGNMTGKALEAAEELEQSSVSVKVVNICTMKPFPYEEVAKLVQGAKAALTVEEHNFIGGLASQTALALRGSLIRMDYVAINDTFGQSAHKPEELLEFYGLTKEHIIQKVKELL